MNFIVTKMYLTMNGKNKLSKKRSIFETIDFSHSTTYIFRI